MGGNQRTTFFRLCDVVRELTDHTIDLNCLSVLDDEVHHVFSLIERDFPLGIQVSAKAEWLCYFWDLETGNIRIQE